MNANQINAQFRKLGLIARIRSGGSYYYWNDENDATTEVPSVYVYRADEMPLEDWVKLAKDADRQIREEREAFASRALQHTPGKIKLNPMRKQKGVHVGDHVIGLAGVDGGYAGIVERVTTDSRGRVIVRYRGDDGILRETPEFNLSTNVPTKGTFPRKNPATDAQYVAFDSLREDEEPFMQGGQKWQFVNAIYPDGRKDIGVYAFSGDVVYGYQNWRAMMNMDAPGHRCITCGSIFEPRDIEQRCPTCQTRPPRTNPSPRFNRSRRNPLLTATNKGAASMSLP